MSEDISLLSALDQPVPLPANSKEEVFNRVDEIFAEALEAKDPTIAFNAGIQLIQIGSLSGLGLAKMAYLLKTRWSEFEKEETFDDIAFELWGKSSTYINRLLSIWHMHEKKIAPVAIIDRPIKDQQAIAKMLEQGFEPTSEEWMKLEDASDNGEVLRTIREIKGVEERKSSRTLVLKRSGDLVIRKGEQMAFLGWLALDNEDDELVAEGIKQILTAGIRRE